MRSAVRSPTRKLHYRTPLKVLSLRSLLQARWLKLAGKSVQRYNHFDLRDVGNQDESRPRRVSSVTRGAVYGQVRGLTCNTPPTCLRASQIVDPSCCAIHVLALRKRFDVLEAKLGSFKLGLFKVAQS